MDLLFLIHPFKCAGSDAMPLLSVLLGYMKIFFKAFVV